MLVLLVRLLAALSLDAACIKFGFIFFLAPPASAVGPSLLSGCIVCTGDDALKTHATKPQNQGGQRTVRTTKRTAAFMAVSGKAVLLLSRGLRTPLARKRCNRQVVAQVSPTGLCFSGGHNPLSMDFF